MKKSILVIALGLVGLTACKKDYTCDCTRTETEVAEDGTTTTTSTRSVTTIEDVKKSTVEDKFECVDSEYKYAYESVWNGTTQVTVTSDCEIKK